MRYLPILLLIFSVNLTYSQLPTCENSKFCFQGIVKLDSNFSSIILFNNAEKWLEKTNKLVESKFDTKTVIGKNEYWVYVNKGVLEKKHGLISHDISIEVKDGKYRYLLNNFVFHYYKLDRYEKFQATGETRKLDVQKVQGWQKLWNKHKITAERKASEMVENLKKEMAKLPIEEKPKEETKKVIEEW